MIPAHQTPGNLLCSFVLRRFCRPSSRRPDQIHNSRRLSSSLSGGSSTSYKRNKGPFHRFSAPSIHIRANNLLSNSIHNIRQKSTLTALQELVQSDALQPDRAQERVAKRLDRLQAALIDYDNSVLFQQQTQMQRQSSSESSSADKIDDKEHERSLDPDTTEDKNEKKTKCKTEQCNDNSDNDRSSSSSSNSTLPPIPTLKIPRGLYIYGNVGTGKTMLMDSFYDNARVPGNDRKQRFHFHDFLSQIHESIHRLKQEDLRERGRNFTIDTSLSNNPIHKVGLQIASKLSLLCLDEFQVTDIADAVILSQLFSVLFRHGTIVVATSNRPPKDLYEGGLNRSYFLPFIDLLEHHCIAYHIPSDRDYRRILSNCSSFFICLASETTAAGGVVNSKQVETIAEELVAGDLFATDDNGVSCNDGNNKGLFQSIELRVGFNRSISIGRVYNYNGENENDSRRKGKPSVARFSFEELCDADLGAMDYRAVANAFDVVTLENIPTMDLEGHNRARRFITLIDELYEGKCALVCSTLHAKTPKELFHTGSATETSVAPSTNGRINSSSTSDQDNNVTNVGDASQYNESGTSETKNQDSEMLGIDVAQEGGTPVGALASVRELSFAFERSSSRIFEMCSRSWWDRVLDKKD